MPKALSEIDFSVIKSDSEQVKVDRGRAWGTWGSLLTILGSCATNKPALEYSLVPPVSSKVLWRETQTVDRFELQTGC